MVENRLEMLNGNKNIMAFVYGEYDRRKLAGTMPAPISVRFGLILQRNHAEMEINDKKRYINMDDEVQLS